MLKQNDATRTDDQEWGTYAPGRGTWFLRLLIAGGMSRGFIGKMIRKKWKRCHPVLIDCTIRGTNYRLNVRDNTTDMKLLVSSKFYDRREIEALGTGDVFIDIGANTGYYSLTLARTAFKKVIAVEPNPPALARLRANIRFNGLEDVITVVPCCVGLGGDVPFYCRGGLGSASMIRPAKLTAPILVKSKPLFEILTEQGITAVDALKIDVEGYEDRALLPFFESAPQSMWPKVIVIEDYHRTDWQEDVIPKLLGLGYRTRFRTKENLILSRS